MPSIYSGEDGGGGRCKAVLTRDDSVRAMECTNGLQCYSPARVVVCRLLSVVKKCKGRRRENSPVADEVEKREVSRVSTDRQRFNQVVPENNQRQEMTFNLAVGLGLLSLIAASKTELEKTAELRQQMEVFLRSVKEGRSDKNDTAKGPDQVECTYAVSTTVDCLSNFSREESGFSFVCDKHCDMYQADRSVEGVSRLEEELEAELERLQIGVETMDGCVETTEVSVNQEDVNETSSNDNATETVSSQEVTNPNNASSIAPEHCGVPPLELERRLHELLEARQQERIKELEAHLEIVKRRLQEKEVEAVWWKDTAKLISKQVPESSRAKKVICDD